MENGINEIDLVYSKKLLGIKLAPEQKKLLLEYLQSRSGPRQGDNVDITFNEYMNLQTAKPEALRSFKLFFEERFGIQMPLDEEEIEQPVRKMRWIIPAAAALFLITTGIWLLYNLYHKKDGGEIAVVPVVRPKLDTMAIPSGDTVVLVLSNRTRVNIKSKQRDGIVAQDSNWVISLRNDSLVYARAKGHMEGRQGYYTVLTPPGRQLGIILPDSSRSALSPGSRFMIAANYGEQERGVELLGEGDFKVTHDSTRPFIVKAGNTSVLDLGTHFNIYAYPGDKYQDITLFEGSVQISVIKAQKAFRSDPITGRQIVKVTDSIIDTYSSNALAISIIENRGKGYFVYSNAPLGKILIDVGRWYGYEVICKDSSVLSRTVNLNGRRRSDPIRQILGDLEASRIVKLDLKGRQIVVSKK